MTCEQYVARAAACEAQAARAQSQHARAGFLELADEWRSMAWPGAGSTTVTQIGVKPAGGKPTHAFAQLRAA